MNTKCALLLSGLILFATTPGYAAPVNWSGDASMKFEKDSVDGGETTSGLMQTIKIKGEIEFSPGWSLYARIGAQHATQPGLSDFNASAYGNGRKTIFSLDQFGIVHKAGDFSYKLGRQEAAVGTTALLYSRPYTNIGKNTFVDGLSLNGKIGVLDISALAAQEDNVGTQDNRLYAIHGAYTLSDRLTMGLTAGRYQEIGGASTNHWAVDGAYKWGKSSLTAEFAKSNVTTDNKAFAATVNYGFDAKNSLYATAFRVEENADMGKQSDFDNNNKGVYYGVVHKFSDAESVEVVYKDQKTLGDGQRNSKLETTFTYSF